ncbi:hypothetical protein PF010_g24790 [Phytophthora fragariae]|uniref:Uncharacterized protein n=1 Tax=Phytophthora fragariae TaxID=53985 RepID=A0A6G0K290_9STRA|nr:hypothetical protein PF010_g24790 [Phytophthora fragariae]
MTDVLAKNNCARELISGTNNWAATSSVVALAWTASLTSDAALTSGAVLSSRAAPGENDAMNLSKSDLVGGDGWFVAATTFAGLDFAEETAFQGHMAGGAGAVSSRSDSESWPPLPAIILGIPRFDTNVVCFTTFFLPLLASATASPETSFCIARLLVRNGADDGVWEAHVRCPCRRRQQLHQRQPSVSLACSCVTARSRTCASQTSSSAPELATRRSRLGSQ